MPYDVREFCTWIVRDFEPAARLPGPAGTYARQPGHPEPDLYGVAGMACILHTLARLHPTSEQRKQWAENLQAFQDPRSGYFLERFPTHDKLHSTAFALGAMHLLDIPPRYPLYFAQQFARPDAARLFLLNLDWTTRVTADSQRAAALASVFALAPGLCPIEWFDTFFLMLDTLVDSTTGLLGRDKPRTGDPDQIGGTFHYLALYEHFHRRLPFGQRRIDALLYLQQPDGLWHPTNHLWLTLAAVYLLNRTLRHTHHRAGAVDRAVRKSLDAVISDLLSPTARQRTFAGEMGVYALTAAVTLLAEAQQFLGAHEVVTETPLRLLLDRRPFI